MTHDYWANASASAWRWHVIESVETGRDLIEDWDRTFHEATRTLSDVYLGLDRARGSEPYDSEDAWSVEDHFWGLERSSTVIDSIVGSACVVLMRWMDQAKRIAIGDFILLETQFPFVVDPETDKQKWSRHHASLMRDFGLKVKGKEVTGALAVWQIGNCFKHGNGTGLHRPTKEVAEKLGFGSHLLDMPENDADEELRQLALQEVNYTLGSDSVERMAIQLGCGPERGLMPLYEHVESWREAIDEKLAAAVGALRKQA